MSPHLAGGRRGQVARPVVALVREQKLAVVVDQLVACRIHCSRRRRGQAHWLRERARSVRLSVDSAAHARPAPLSPNSPSQYGPSLLAWRDKLQSDELAICRRPAATQNRQGRASTAAAPHNGQGGEGGPRGGSDANQTGTNIQSGSTTRRAGRRGARADAGRAVVGRVVAHGREDAPAKVDAAHPAVVAVVALVREVAALLDDLAVQPEDVDGAVVAARPRARNASAALLLGVKAVTGTALLALRGHPNRG